MLEPYKIEYPPIPSAGKYLFTTYSDIEYEVRFAKQKENPFRVSLAFGVLNEEYEGEEYSLTNKGEAYRVMSTIVTIIKDFIIQHPNTHTLIFSGEPTAKEDEKTATKRLNLYKKYIPEIFDNSWKLEVKGNKAKIIKKSPRSFLGLKDLFS